MDPPACCENAFHTGSNYEVVVCTVSVCCPCAKFLLDVFVLLSGAPLSVVVSDAMGVELFFLARTVSGTADKGAPDKSTKTSNRNLDQGQQTDDVRTDTSYFDPV